MADFLFAPVADAVYATPARYGSLDALAGVLAFSGQIYYDFAGYSLCAIGLALCFGFEFPDNFRYPYAAIGLRDFWRRWHISLSTWIRDYLYLPLGGSRCGPFRNHANLLLTMTLAGLWHGASPMFLLWGLLHGCYLSLERLLTLERPLPTAGLPAFIGCAVTVLLVSLTWIPFRAPDLPTLSALLDALLNHETAPQLDTYTRLGAYVGFIATLVWQWRWREASPELAIGQLATIPRAALLATCLLLIFLCSGGDERAFIYFQF
jgi:D-alanyl-lipoteichoic acid acyltransferase DltB (MBOAT superfamily)